MRLHIICNSKEKNIELSNGIYKVKLKSLAVKGKANKELISYFKSFGYKIEIIKGEKSRDKLIKIIK